MKSEVVKEDGDGVGGKDAGGGSASARREWERMGKSGRERMRRRGKGGREGKRLEVLWIVHFHYSLASCF